MRPRAVPPFELRARLQVNEFIWRFFNNYARAAHSGAGDANHRDPIQPQIPLLGLGGSGNGLSVLQGLLPLYFAFVFFAIVAAYVEPLPVHSVIQRLP